MAKRSVLLIIIALFTLSFCSCSKTEITNDSSNEDKSNEEIFTLWIYPSSSINGAYKISLLKNNILQVNMGEYEFSDFSNPTELTEVEIESKKYLGDIDYGIMDSVEAIYNDQSIKTSTKVYVDAWMIKYSYKDKNIIQPCDEDISPELEGLYKFLIELSPINIDMRGFA